MSPIRHRGRRRPWTPETGSSEALDREGRAIVASTSDPQRREARVDGALAGERFVFLRSEREGEVDRARVVEVLEPAADRVPARCVHYGVCGGCSLMHMHPDAQVAHKQSVLLGDLERHGLRPETILAPLRAEPWGYRRRARLGAKWVAAKQEVVVGFREKDHRFIARLAGCEILAGDAGALITPLARLIATLDVVARVPQIEVSIGDEPGDRALVLRVLDPLGDADRARLLEFGERERVRMFVQPGGLDSVYELGESASPGLLHYRLAAHQLELGFRPTDFVQVNGAINQAMIDRALDLLQLEPGQRVLDLFCGLGNFSLAIARRVAEVVALEGDAGLVARAEANAAANGLTNLRFASCDLYGEFTDLERLAELERPFDRVLIDPPRSGALKLVERFDRLAAPRVVYVACSPETLARDLAILVERHGYRLRAAGIIDMFPHTAHVESIALLER
ncbi:23S rRNA (uracil(1939)-C(5))-methyltransferase RlmD [Nannocystaceae bacterium ST9]